MMKSIHPRHLRDQPCTVKQEKSKSISGDETTYELKQKTSWGKDNNFGESPLYEYSFNQIFFSFQMDFAIFLAIKMIVIVCLV